MDLIADFAAAVPIQLVGDMLGVPEAERGPLRDWSLAILSGLEPVLTPAQRERGDRAVAEFKAYLRDLIDRRGREPSRDEAEILSTLTAGSVLDRTHFLSAGVVSFARGLNDTPKIAALLLLAPALGVVGSLAVPAICHRAGCFDRRQGAGELVRSDEHLHAEHSCGSFRLRPATNQHRPVQHGKVRR